MVYEYADPPKQGESSWGWGWNIQSSKSIWNIDPGLFFEGADESVYIIRPPEKKYIYYMECRYFI